MPLFRSRKANPKSPPPDPMAQHQDLMTARQLMDTWDSALGHSERIWAALEAVGHAGGYRGGQATLMETIDSPGYTAEILDRPWRWLLAVSRLAQESHDDALSARIFLFAYLFRGQISPSMKMGDHLDTGLSAIMSVTYVQLEELGVSSLKRLDPNAIIHQSANERLTVSAALQIAATH